MVAGEAVLPDGSSVITPGLYRPGHAPLTLASEIWPSAAGTKKRAPEGTRFF
jgi:hypothetical protein